MTARKAKEPIAATTFGEVEGHCSLSVRSGLSRDAEAEGGSEGTNNLDELIHGIDGFVKLRSDLARVEGFAEVYVDVGDLVVLEKG